MDSVFSHTCSLASSIHFCKYLRAVRQNRYTLVVINNLKGIKIVMVEIIVGFVIENAIIVLPILAVSVAFNFLFRKGLLEKWVEYRFATENLIDEKIVTPSNGNLVFKPKDSSFLIVWAVLIILTAFFVLVFFADSSASALLRIIFLIVPLMSAFYIFYMPLTYISKINVSPKNLGFEKFFPSRIININPESVEKVIVGIVEDISGMNLANTLIFCIKGGKTYNFIIPYYDAEAIINVLAQFPKAIQSKEKLSFFRQVHYAIKSRLNLEM